MFATETKPKKPKDPLAGVPLHRPAEGEKLSALERAKMSLERARNSRASSSQGSAAPGGDKSPGAKSSAERKVSQKEPPKAAWPIK